VSRGWRKNGFNKGKKSVMSWHDVEAKERERERENQSDGERQGWKKRERRVAEKTNPTLPAEPGALLGKWTFFSLSRSLTVALAHNKLRGVLPRCSLVPVRVSPLSPFLTLCRRSLPLPFPPLSSSQKLNFLTSRPTCRRQFTSR